MPHYDNIGDHRKPSTLDPAKDDDYQDPSRLEYHKTGDYRSVSKKNDGRHSEIVESIFLLIVKHQVVIYLQSIQRLLSCRGRGSTTTAGPV